MTGDSAATARPARIATTPRASAAREDAGAVRRIEPDQAEILAYLRRAGSPTKRRTPARDPWQGTLPSALGEARAAIKAGSRGKPSSIAALRRYNIDNPNDVYGRLVLAGMLANHGWSGDALDLYDAAYQIDPSSRGDPDVLTNTLNMVVRGSAASEAETFIARTFQREALPAIERALRARGLDSAASARLKNLRARIAARRN